MSNRKRGGPHNPIQKKRQCDHMVPSKCPLNIGTTFVTYPWLIQRTTKGRHSKRSLSFPSNNERREMTASDLVGTVILGGIVAAIPAEACWYVWLVSLRAAALSSSSYTAIDFFQRYKKTIRSYCCCQPTETTTTPARNRCKSSLSSVQSFPIG